MTIRNVVLSAAAVALVCGVQSEASAAGRRAMRAAQPAPTATTASTTPTTILPSAAEIAAVPVPGQGPLLSYPVDVIRYGLTVHPGARIARGLLGR